jgi:serine/threonine protein kinase
MRFLSDEAVAHLREITELPELSGTRYELVRELGRGGMGVVYEVRDHGLERNVALKVVETDWRDHRGAEEARIIAALEHPGIVPVHDAGTLPDGRLYYTMKLVRGTRLDQWAKESHGITERLRLVARICEPVAFAHARGVIHRDLKPENVMVGELGTVLVMDWGILGVGTPGYMAPELQSGETAGPRSDVYALGVLLAFLVAGETLPRRLRAIVERACAADPASRYADARELAQDLLRYLDGEPVAAYREGVVDRTERWLSRNQVLITLLAAYIAMRVIAFFWMGP